MRVKPARKNKGTTRSRTPAWLWLIPLAALVGLAANVVFVTELDRSIRWGVFATSVMLATAAALVGGVLGFLFGIPRTLPGTSAGDAPAATRYQPNTNLEQISDWLTKILVGVALVQVGRALPALATLGHNLEGPLGKTSSSSTFGLALLITYSTTGFLYGYLWSRLRLVGELRDADVVEAQIESNESRKTEALAVANRQLTPQAEPPAQRSLDQALAAAPDATRVLVFNEAERIRRETCRHEKPIMERTIPVFRALIAADPDEEHHRNHGSLAFALKDQAVPDWHGALNELTTAMRIRDTHRDGGWRVYEVQRALCNIQLNDALRTAPTRNLVQLINADLRAAAGDPLADQAIRESPEIQVWITTHPL